MAYLSVKKKVGNVECLFESEGNVFSLTGSVTEDLLNILAVHPMQEDAVRLFLTKAGADWALVDYLIAHGYVMATDYEG